MTHSGPPTTRFPPSCRSPPPASEPYLDLDLDRTAGVVEVAADFLADGVTNLLGQRRQYLASGTGAAFVGTIEGIERRQREGMPLAAGLNVHEAGILEQRHQPCRLADGEIAIVD